LPQADSPCRYRASTDTWSGRPAWRLQENHGLSPRAARQQSQRRRGRGATMPRADYLGCEQSRPAVAERMRAAARRGQRLQVLVEGASARDASDRHSGNRVISGGLLHDRRLAVLGWLGEPGPARGTGALAGAAALAAYAAISSGRKGSVSPGGRAPAGPTPFARGDAGRRRWRDQRVAGPPGAVSAESARRGPPDRPVRTFRCGRRVLRAGHPDGWPTAAAERPTPGRRVRPSSGKSLERLDPPGSARPATRRRDKKHPKWPRCVRTPQTTGVECRCWGRGGATFLGHHYRSVTAQGRKPLRRGRHLTPARDQQVQHGPFVNR